MQPVRIYNLKRDTNLPQSDSMKFRHSFNPLPPQVDLRQKLPPVYDQGQLGSCTAQAGAAAYSYLSQKPPNPSKIFLYYNSRLLYGGDYVSEDSGSSLTNCVNAMKQFGMCPEKLSPYDISKLAIKPSQECYDKAKQNLVTEVYQITQSLHELKACLASNYPFIFGFTVYSSFESEVVSRTGDVPMPGKDEAILGGHALLCCGYDDSRSVFICRNS